eukprot:g343.t1
MRVQTQYTIAEGGDGRWYSGRVGRLFGNNRCKIYYDDGPLPSTSPVLAGWQELEWHPGHLFSEHSMPSVSRADHTGDPDLQLTEHQSASGEISHQVVQQEEATEYFAALASFARSVFKKTIFQAFMFLCLFIALFAADVFVIINVNNDVVLDSILTVLILAWEPNESMLHRVTYSCSFYFWMDLLGILSVPLDHSLVVNALPSGLDSNTAIMRAARMAKLGARAGRFTKLVKLLRFLPFMQQTNAGGTAKVISATLNVALSMRVSLLIILMVLVLPLFSLATFPENDYSMTMWVQMISDTASVEPQYLEEVLGNFTLFYQSSNYFPFQASIDYQNGTVVTRSLGEAPARPRASIQLQAGQTTAFFNFTSPQQVDAVLNCLLMVTIMVLMVLSALFLSNTVSHIVLTPLESATQRSVVEWEAAAGSRPSYGRQHFQVDGGAGDQVRGRFGGRRRPGWRGRLWH